jgi:hypothetical protein
MAFWKEPQENKLSARRKLDKSFLNALSLLLKVSYMSFSIVLLLISLPVLTVCAFAMYMGMSGLEKKKEKRVKDRKALENALISNGMWRLVGTDPVTLDKAIRFLLEDQRARAGMSDEERMKKAGLLKEYKNSVTGFKGMSRKNISWKDVEWEQDMSGNKPIVGLDEPINYDPLGWIAGLPFSSRK